MDDKTLHGYLQHHWVGSTAGVDLFRRVAGGFTDPAVAQELHRIGEEVAQDRESLKRIMASVGVEPSLVGTVAAKVGERFGRLKPNGDLLHRTPLTDVVELESLRLALTGKRVGFQLLASLAPDDDRLDGTLIDELQRRGDEHLAAIEKLHIAIGADRIAGGAADTE